MLKSNLTYQDEPFSCSYGPVTRAVGSFREECVQVACLIGEQADGLIPTVMLSGGMDSEVVCLAFLEAGVPFKAMTFRYPGNILSHELVHAERAARRLKLDLTYFDIDILRWIRSEEAARLFLESNAWSLTMVPHMKVMSAIYAAGGLPILGNGEVLLKNMRPGWSYIEYEYDLAWYRHAERNGIPAVCGFFQHTPEVMASALLHPRHVELGLGRNKLANTVLQTSRPVKYKMYTDLWTIGMRDKYDGGEKLRGTLMEQEIILRGRQAREYNREYIVPYLDFTRQLGVQVPEDPSST